MNPNIQTQTIAITADEAYRLAELLRYLSAMTHPVVAGLDEPDEMHLRRENASAAFWAQQLREAAFCATPARIPKDFFNPTDKEGKND